VGKASRPWLKAVTELRYVHYFNFLHIPSTLAKNGLGQPPLSSFRQNLPIRHTERKTPWAQT
jgi:hypothetical protein